MVVLSLPVFKSGMIWQILTGSWSPDHGKFGILSMIVGTFYIALLSLVISFPISLGCSFFIQVTRPGRAGGLLKKLVQFMTAIPTVIYGFGGRVSAGSHGAKSFFPRIRHEYFVGSHNAGSFNLPHHDFIFFTKF